MQELFQLERGSSFRFNDGIGHMHRRSMDSEAIGVGSDSCFMDKGSEGHFRLLSGINILSERSLAFGLVRTGAGFGR